SAKRTHGRLLRYGLSRPGHRLSPASLERWADIDMHGDRLSIIGLLQSDLAGPQTPAGLGEQAQLPDRHLKSLKHQHLSGTIANTHWRQRLVLLDFNIIQHEPTT